MLKAIAIVVLIIVGIAMLGTVLKMLVWAAVVAALLVVGVAGYKVLSHSSGKSTPSIRR